MPTFAAVAERRWQYFRNEFSQIWRCGIIGDDLIHHRNASVADNEAFSFREHARELFDLGFPATANIAMRVLGVDEKRLPELFEMSADFLATHPTNLDFPLPLCSAVGAKERRTLRACG
jgi:hypothetical protein